MKTRGEVKTILINFPTNMGDSIMGLPVLDRLRAKYPQAKITAICSPHTKNFFIRNSFLDEIVIFNKLWRIKEKIRFCLSLRKRYDLIVDLKNSLLPILLGARLRTPFHKNANSLHSKDFYLSLIKGIAADVEVKKGDFPLTQQEEDKWKRLNLAPSIFIACSSRSLIKRYPYPYLKKVVKNLIEDYPVIILGEENDRNYYQDILTMERVTDLLGRTTMAEVFYLLKNYTLLLLCVDSSILHLGSYLLLPIVAIFGPTDPFRYGPWSDKFVILRQNDLTCLPCQKANCKFNQECMEIEPKEVIKAVRILLSERNI